MLAGRPLGLDLGDQGGRAFRHDAQIDGRKVRLPIVAQPLRLILPAVGVVDDLALLGRRLIEIAANFFWMARPAHMRAARPGRRPASNVANRLSNEPRMGAPGFYLSRSQVSGKGNVSRPDRRHPGSDRVARCAGRFRSSKSAVFDRLLDSVKMAAESATMTISSGAQR